MLKSCLHIHSICFLNKHVMINFPYLAPLKSSQARERIKWWKRVYSHIFKITSQTVKPGYWSGKIITEPTFTHVNKHFVFIWLRLESMHERLRQMWRFETILLRLSVNTTAICDFLRHFYADPALWERSLIFLPQNYFTLRWILAKFTLWKQPEFEKKQSRSISMTYAIVLGIETDIIVVLYLSWWHNV